jgi:hypothetical protein
MPPPSLSWSSDAGLCFELGILALYKISQALPEKFVENSATSSGYRGRMETTPSPALSSLLMNPSGAVFSSHAAGGRPQVIQVLKFFATVLVAES